MYYTRSIPDILLKAPFRKVPLDLAMNAILTLTHNNIPFMIEYKGGQWEITVPEQYKRDMDVIIRHFGTLTENEVVFS